MSFWKRLFGSAPKPSPAGQSPAPAPLPDFPFPLLKIAGDQAPSEWRKHQDEWRQEGCSAVVLSVETVHAFAPLLKADTQPPHEIIASAEKCTAKDFFIARAKQNEEDGAEVEIGAWPAGPVTSTTLSAHREIGHGAPFPFVFLAKIPTTKAWEIPAYLKFGGWNDCPEPAEQITVLRHWSERHGIEIYSVSTDVLECSVARPPKTKEAALALAQEQFLFCGDIVFQGTETISGLAAGILDADAWFFWWD